jgi:hypothetical protein
MPDLGRLRRTSLWRLSALLALAAFIPACGKQQQQGLTILNFSPLGGAVARQLTVYIDFDRPLDANTWPTSFTFTDNLGNPVAANVSYDATVDQIQLRPTGGALNGGTQYTVTILSSLTGADQSTFMGDAFQFTTQATTPTNGGQPTFPLGLTGAVPTPAVAPNPAPPASIDLSWTAATDAPDGDSITYDVFMSSISNGQDFSAPLLSTANPSGITVNSANGLESGVTYYFVVRARESTSGNSEFNVIQRSATTH